MSTAKLRSTVKLRVNAPFSKKPTSRERSSSSLATGGRRKDLSFRTLISDRPLGVSKNTRKERASPGSECLSVASAVTPSMRRNSFMQSCTPLTTVYGISCAAPRSGRAQARIRARAGILGLTLLIDGKVDLAHCLVHRSLKRKGANDFQISSLSV